MNSADIGIALRYGKTAARHGPLKRRPPFGTMGRTALGEIGPMTLVEHRRHSRYALLRKPVGEFQLRTPTETYPIKVINDISNSGIRIYLDTSLTARLQVVVEYVEPSRKLEVNGVVAWCAERPRAADDGNGRGRFIIGIRLLSPMLLIALSGAY